MTDPTFSISIERASLSLTPLLLSGNDGEGSILGVVDYTEPAMQARIRYAPSSDFQHGDLPLSWSWQQTFHNFDVAATPGSTEQAQRDAVSELRAAVARLSYELTVTVGGADPEVWACNPGSITPAGGRTFVDLRDANPVWRVAIPCYPVRSVA